MNKLRKNIFEGMGGAYSYKIRENRPILISFLKTEKFGCEGVIYAGIYKDNY